MRTYYLPMFLLAIYYCSWGQTFTPLAKEPADNNLPISPGLPPTPKGERQARSESYFQQDPKNGINQAATPAATMLFQISPSGAPPPELPDATRYQLLRPDLEKIRRLYAGSPALLRLAIPQESGPALILELERVEMRSDDFLVEWRLGGSKENPLFGLHYRGRIAGKKNSLAAVSIFPDEATGLWSEGDTPGNWVLGRMKGARQADPYLLYEDAGLVFNSDFTCKTPDAVAPHDKTDLARSPRPKNAGSGCVDLFLEVDYDVFKDKGGAENTIKYISSLFNQMAAVFAQDDLSVQLSRLYIWNAPSPYMGATVDRQLSQFQEYRTGWQGNLAQLISYKVNGGVAAGFNGLCAADPAESMSYAGIQSHFSSIPNYSWTVNVTAHELGHLLGVRHTHACVWYETGISIDDCGNVVMAKRNQEPEGLACYAPNNPKYPSEGGTLMSYCHLIEGVGINLSKGFHEEPAAVIHHNLREANCLGECAPQAASNINICVGNIITLSLTLDNFGSETTWKIKDENGLTLYQGGPYADGRRGQVIEKELCLGIGCFTFEILDAYGDGICCLYGEGAYSLTDTSGLAVAQGGRFNDRDVAEFCLPTGSEAPPLRDDCQVIQFNDLPVGAYAGAQDEGEYEIRDEGYTIRIWGNAWKSVPLNYEIGPYTLLEFDFASTAPAEIHGIGLDTDDKTSFNRTFKLFGSQNWGIMQYFQYETCGEWMSFIIPVGMHFTGPVKNMFFCVDDDIAPKTGDSWFRNIRLYESGDCFVDLAKPDGAGLAGVERPLSMRIFPNPVREELQIAFSGPAIGMVRIQLLDMTGRLLRQKTAPASGNGWERIWVNDLPPGTYFLKVEAGGEILVDKVALIR